MKTTQHFLLALLLMCTSIQLFAQAEEFSTTEWYLNYISVENQELTPPSNETYTPITMYVEGEQFFTNFCNTLFETINVEDEHYTYGGPLIQTLAECNPDDVMEFEGTYFSLFFDNAENPFTYEITTENNGSKTLVITTDLGDQAVYGSEQLSVNEQSIARAKIFPNPVTDNFRIQTKNADQIEQVAVYDLTGKKVATFDNSSSYSLVNLPSEIYVVKIKTSTAERFYKIIKK